MNFVIYLLGIYSAFGCLVLSFPFYERNFALLAFCFLFIFIHCLLIIKYKNNKLFTFFNIIIFIIVFLLSISSFLYGIDVILQKYMEVSVYTFPLFNKYNYYHSLYHNIIMFMTIMIPINYLNFTLFQKQKYLFSFVVLSPLLIIELLFTITPPYYCIGPFLFYVIYLVFHLHDNHFHFLPLFLCLSLMMSILYFVPPSSYRHPRSLKNHNLSYSTPSIKNDYYSLKDKGNISYSGETILTITGQIKSSLKLRGAVYTHYSGDSWYQDSENISKEYSYCQNIPSLSQYLDCQYSTIEIKDHTNSIYKYVPYYITSFPSQLYYYGSHFEGENNIYEIVNPNNEWNQFLTNDSKKEILLNSEYSFSDLLSYAFNNEDYYIPEQTKKVLIQFLMENEIYDYYYQYIDMLDQNQINKIEEIKPDKTNIYNYINKIKNALFKQTTYSLQPGYTPDDVDFFDYFLNINKKGYCVHYASTLALLLNISGFEANFVTGYQVDANMNDKINIYDSDAHAWIEIYDPVLGIIPIEATPASSSVNNNQTNNNQPIIQDNTTLFNNNNTNHQDINNNDIIQQSSSNDFYYILYICIFLLIVFGQSRVRYHLSFYKLKDEDIIKKLYIRLQKLHYPLSQRFTFLVKKCLFSQYHLTKEEKDECLNYYKETLFIQYKKAKLYKKFIFKIIYAYI